jgi:hypothetical protein
MPSYASLRLARSTCDQIKAMISKTAQVRGIPDLDPDAIAAAPEV